MSEMPKTRERDSKSGERGSALLIVFVFAAAVAIMLYMEMPVAVFEAQREKEQLLIDLGNEYAHGPGTPDQARGCGKLLRMDRSQTLSGMTRRSPIMTRADAVTGTRARGRPAPDAAAPVGR